MTAPINVRIASFVGWKDVQSIGVRGGVEKWVGIRPDWVCCCGAPQETEPRDNFGCTCWGFDPIPDYLHSWESTGPLIERYGITLESEPWCAYVYMRNPAECVEGGGRTPLQAVVNLLLALSERAAQSEGE